MTGVPLRDVRRVKRRDDAVRGLFAGILMFGIVARMPAALLVVVGNPVSGLRGQGRDLLNLHTQVEVQFVLYLAVCVVWLAWARFAEAPRDLGRAGRGCG